MKARINLTPELQRKALEMARTQLRLESCFATQAMVLLAALTLAEEFGFGRERIERFCAKMQETLFRFEERHGDDWPDAAMNAIRAKGVEIFEDGWITERQALIDKSKPREPDPVVPLKLHGELERFRKALEGKE